jgi:hypothetical protein
MGYKIWALSAASIYELPCLSRQKQLPRKLPRSSRRSCWEAPSPAPVNAAGRASVREISPGGTGAGQRKSRFHPHRHLSSALGGRRSGEPRRICGFLSRYIFPDLFGFILTSKRQAHRGSFEWSTRTQGARMGARGRAQASRVQRR